MYNKNMFFFYLYNLIILKFYTTFLKRVLAKLSKQFSINYEVSKDILAIVFYDNFV